MNIQLKNNHAQDAVGETDTITPNGEPTYSERRENWRRHRNACGQCRRNDFCLKGHKLIVLTLQREYDADSYDDYVCNR